MSINISVVHELLLKRKLRSIKGPILCYRITANLPILFPMTFFFLSFISTASTW